MIFCKSVNQIIIYKKCKKHIRILDQNAIIDKGGKELKEREQKELNLINSYNII